MAQNEFTAEAEALRDQLGKAKLGRHADALLALSLPAIRLMSNPADEDSLPRGASKLGGRPDLPPDFDWPRFRDLPLSFIAQVNLAHVAMFDEQNVLPRFGLLSFFYDAERQLWGFDPADRGSWHVAFTPDASALIRLAAPADLPVDGQFRCADLQPRAELTLPPWDAPETGRLGMTRGEVGAYIEFMSKNGSTAHRLLGHASPFQSDIDMRLECQLVSNGLYYGGPSVFQEPRFSLLESGAADWRLLLQVDTDDACGMMWGDVGRIYYWIWSADLADNNFDRTWMVLQCF